MWNGAIVKHLDIYDPRSLINSKNKSIFKEAKNNNILILNGDHQLLIDTRLLLMQYVFNLISTDKFYISILDEFKLIDLIREIDIQSTKLIKNDEACIIPSNKALYNKIADIYNDYEGLEHWIIAGFKDVKLKQINSFLNRTFIDVDNVDSYYFLFEFIIICIEESGNFIIYINESKYYDPIIEFINANKKKD